MDPELQLILESVTTVANTEFSTKYTGTKYGELTNFHTDARGFVKLFATAESAMFKRFRGKGNVTGMTEASHKIIADLFTMSRRIPIQKWKQLLAWLGSNLPGAMATAGNKAAFKSDDIITELLNLAVSGGSINSLYGTNAFIGKNIAIPGSSGEQRLTNRLDPVELTEDSLRELYWRAVENLNERVCPDGSPYFDSMDLDMGMRVMYAPTAKMSRLINKVFDTGKTTSRDQVDKITGVTTVPNNLWMLPKYNHLNGKDGGGVLIYYPNMGNLRAFQFVQTMNGLGFEFDLPQQDSGGSQFNFVPAEQQLNREYTWTVTKEMEVGAGSSQQFLWADLTKIR